MLSAYIAQDRRHALARGVDLPQQTSGAALFADISGFTPLAAALTRTLGSRRGAEELAAQLNRLYSALIAEVERYGGSVIEFGGDAITCWFAAEPAHETQPINLAPTVERTLACALAMQGSLARLGLIGLPSGGTVLLAMKIGIACGPAQRLVVGDPSIRLLDVLAGATLARMALAERVAHRAEIVLSPECYVLLGDLALVVEWRGTADGPGQERYPVVSGLMLPVASQPWPPLPPATLTPEQLRPWLLPAIYAQHQHGAGEPAPELRPVTALFLSFLGIDYDNDPAAETKLDRFVRWIQAVLTRYAGDLIQLTTGDKGSYLFIAFGGFAAHEDDAQRALAAALELRSPPAWLGFPCQLKIGISQGIMCSGAYGSSARRTYGAIGDETNLAARLMQMAGFGEVLVSGQMQQALTDRFHWQLLPAIAVKGKPAPVPIARLLGAATQFSQGAHYARKLVGRAVELDWLHTALQPIRNGAFGGVVAIFGEAGVGKSRLVYEIRQELTTDTSLRWLTCPAEQLSPQPLHVFRYLLRLFCEQTADQSAAAAQARFNAMLDTLIATTQHHPDRELAQALEQARPFLAALIDLRWDGSAYELADPGARLAATLNALKALLCAESLRQPLVVQLEDAHALDPASLACLRLLTAGAAGFPFAIILTGRSHDDGRRLILDLDPTVPYQALELRPLAAEAVHTLISQLLEAACDDGLAALLLTKTGGNALFVEQLVLDLRERGALTRDAAGSWQLQRQVGFELPTTITGVLTARLDRLPPELRSLAQTAAVLGQEFDAHILERVHDSGQPAAELLSCGGDANLWQQVGERRWRFRHALLRDAAYEMQLRSRLRDLHQRAAQAIEHVYSSSLAGQIAELAHHYRQAEDVGRESHYLAILGEQAYESSHFREAIGALQRALELTQQLGGSGLHQRAHLGYRLARTYSQLGATASARQWLIASCSDAELAGDLQLAADAAYHLGVLDYRLEVYVEALDNFEQSLERYRQVHDYAGAARALNQLASVYMAMNDEQKALECYAQALALPRGMGGRRR